jgi:hypothetical protein
MSDDRSGMSLKRALFDAYGRKVKNIDRIDHFVVDDRNEGDIASDRQLYSYFCQIVAQVAEEGAAVKVTLSGNVPRSASTEQWCGRHSVSGSEHGMVFNVSRGNVDILADLARAILAIVAHGAARYSVPSYKYVCPRTAGSLMLLHRILVEHWA